MDPAADYINPPAPLGTCTIEGRLYELARQTLAQLDPVERLDVPLITLMWAHAAETALARAVDDTR